MKINNRIPSNYIQILSNLKQRINQARYKSLQKVNREIILTYLDIGKTISNEVKNGWGNSVIINLSKDLRAEFIGIKGFSERNLRRMKYVYEQSIINLKWPQLVAKLPWRHSSLIFSKIKDTKQRTFYLNKASDDGWSRSVLEEKIRFDVYTKQIGFQNNFNKTINKNEIVNYRLQFQDEYNLSFLNLEDSHTEKQFENAIVKNITKTLGQFGNDFTFMGQQFRLEFDDKEYFIDLLFYHRKLKSLIAIELKVSEFKPEYSQQLNWYLHLLDKTIKYEDDNKSIGILLCKTKSSLTVEYSLELVNHPMGIATYTYSELPKDIAINLPSESEFKKLLD